MAPLNQTQQFRSFDCWKTSVLMRRCQIAFFLFLAKTKGFCVCVWAFCLIIVLRDYLYLKMSHVI